VPVLTFLLEIKLSNCVLKDIVSELVLVNQLKLEYGSLNEKE